MISVFNLHQNGNKVYIRYQVRILDKTSLITVSKRYSSFYVNTNTDTSSIEKKKILLTFERGVCLPLWFYKKVIVYLALSETNPEAAVRRCSVKKVVLKISQNSQENTYVGVCLTWNFTKKETPTQLFYCEFCEIFKNTFFIKHLRWLLLTNLSHQLSLMERLSM